jgi:hypothetical protein
VRLVKRLLPGNESALLVALLIVTAVGVALVVRLSGRRDSRHS